MVKALNTLFTQDQIDVIKKTLDSLPFVRWDRYVDYDVEFLGKGAQFYGWIDRDDGKHDFIILAFIPQEGYDNDLFHYFVTSSKTYDPQIAKILYGTDPTEPCQRIEWVFPDLKKVIKL